MTKDMSQSGGAELIETIDGSHLTDIGKDIAELSIDALLEEGALRDLPIVGWVAGLAKTGLSVRERLFAKKLLGFLAEVGDLPEDQRRKAVVALSAGRSEGEIGETLLGYLERSENGDKAAFLGRLFALLVEGEVSPEDFWKVSNAIHQISFADLLSLPAHLPKANTPERDHRLNQICLSAGLGHQEMLVNGFKLVLDNKLTSALLRSLERPTD